jgi:teichuronic acid biosynthesis glycosyltransferase TuaG
MIKSSIDVVIPTYNSDEFLERAIDSILSQTHPVSKIIVVDDGSSEKSQKFLMELEKRYDILEVIFNQHTGLPGVGRHIGILKSEADWIAFLDSDDFWAPEKIQKQLQVAQELGSDLIYTNAYKVKPGLDLEIFHSTLPKTLKIKELLRTNWIVNSSVMVKRRVFDRNLLYAISPRVRAVEDYSTWLRLATECNFHGIDEPLTFYNDSGLSIRSSDTEDPRLHALCDFLVWSKGDSRSTNREIRRYRRWAFSAIKRQYFQ